MPVMLLINYFEMEVYVSVCVCTYTIIYSMYNILYNIYRIETKVTRNA